MTDADKVRDLASEIYIKMQENPSEWKGLDNIVTTCKTRDYDLPLCKTYANHIWMSSYENTPDYQSLERGMLKTEELENVFWDTIRQEIAKDVEQKF
jgi:hypothetical protein